VISDRFNDVFSSQVLTRTWRAAYRATKALLLPALLLLLPQFAATQSTDADFNVGFTVAELKALYSSQESYFIQLVKDDDSYRAVKVSSIRLRREDESQEILGYSLSARKFIPAFDELPSHDEIAYEQCIRGVDGRKKDPTIYAPCHSGSAFVETSVGTSAFVNVFAVATTLGTKVSRVLKLNDDLIRRIVTENRLLETIEAMGAGNAIAVQAMADVRAEDERVKNGLVPVITVTNLTGFPVRPITEKDLNIRLQRSTAIPRLNEISPNSFESELGAYQLSVEQQKQALLAETTFDVACPSTASVMSGQARFLGTVTCDRAVVAKGPALQVRANVALERVSFGLSLPQIAAANKELAAVVSGKSLELTNRTGEYIEIASIAVYGGTQIIDNEQKLSLAPFATMTLAMTGLISRDIAKLFTFDEVTASSLSGQSAVFGIAVKYRVGDGGNFATLLKRESIEPTRLLSKLSI
jgi:hypothetical protein